MSNTDIEFSDFIDLINFTLSEEFLDKWKFRFSSKFIKEFQKKLIKSLKDRKPIKIESLHKHLLNKCGYSNEQIKNFFYGVDIDIYHPIVLGKLSSLDF
jgi:hypothetical protein